MVWKVVGIGAVFLSACSASSDAGSTNLEQAIVGDWTAAPGASAQQPTAVSYHADHTYLQEGGSSHMGQGSASGTWSLKGTLLTVELGCSDSGVTVTCVETPAPRVDVTVEGDTLGWHFGDHTTVWSFLRKR